MYWMYLAENQLLILPSDLGRSLEDISRFRGSDWEEWEVER